MRGERSAWRAQNGRGLPEPSWPGQAGGHCRLLLTVASRGPRGLWGPGISPVSLKTEATRPGLGPWRGGSGRGRPSLIRFQGPTSKGLQGLVAGHPGTLPLGGGGGAPPRRAALAPGWEGGRAKRKFPQLWEQGWGSSGLCGLGAPGSLPPPLRDFRWGIRPLWALAFFSVKLRLEITASWPAREGGQAPVRCQRWASRPCRGPSTHGECCCHVHTRVYKGLPKTRDWLSEQRDGVQELSLFHTHAHTCLHTHEHIIPMHTCIHTHKHASAPIQHTHTHTMHRLTCVQTGTQFTHTVLTLTIHMHPRSFTHPHTRAHPCTHTHMHTRACSRVEASPLLSETAARADPCTPALPCAGDANTF